MRALVIHAARDLRTEQHPEPEPGPGQVQVRLAMGGICGSDLHYFNNGGFGSVRLKEPMVLGHEVAGYVQRIGEGVAGIDIGQLVAVNPSRPCGRCEYCQQGLQNHCPDMRYYGSAMPFPHIQGAFQDVLVVDSSQCVNADGLTANEAATAEPLSVGLHVVKRIGSLMGRRLLLTGCGPIGLLTMLAARRAGATEIVAVDLSDEALAHARNAGADTTINIGKTPDALAKYAAGKGYFHAHIEASGAQSALHAGIAALRPRGVLMQLGLGGDMTVPMLQITAKEIDLRGSFRFHEEFETAVKMMQAGLIDVKPLITHVIPVAQAEQAFLIAADRSQSMKTHITFE
ncbi:MAG: L-idonate 5-dehydrogenase [Burkholderiaceae bacterium]